MVEEHTKKEEDVDESLNPKRMDKQLKIIVYCCIVALLGFVLFLFVKSSLEATPGTYYYQTDTDSFLVQQRDTPAGVDYSMEIFVNNQPDPLRIHLRIDPKEGETVPIGIDKDEFLSKKQHYIVIDPEENLTGETTIAALEINKFVDNPYLFNIPVNSAFLSEFQDFPVKTCDDATDEVGIIWLRLGDTTGLYEEDGCYIVQGTTQTEIIKAADTLALYLMGVLK